MDGCVGCVKRGSEDQVVPIVNHPTITELLRALAYPKFRLSQSEREDVLAEYLPFCATLAFAAGADAPAVRDAADKHFLQLALAAKVAFLVTGDNDLLVLASTLSSDTVRIVTPEQFRLELAHRASRV